MERRTFLEYVSDYGQENFNTYVRLFINWSEVNGSIERHFTNSGYSYEHGNFYASNLWELKEFSDKPLAAFTQKIKEMGYRTDFFKDNKDVLAAEIKNIELEFCEIFLSTFFKKINHTYRGAEASTIDEVLDNFKAFQGGKIFKNKQEADFFWTNFEDFLRYMPYGNKKIEEKRYGYALVRGFNHDWMDIGVVIYDKEWLSHQILFYQIGDNN